MSDAGWPLAVFGLFAGIWKLALVLAMALILYGRSTSAWRRWFRMLGSLIPSPDRGRAPIRRRWPWLTGRRVLALLMATLALAVLLTKLASTYSMTPAR